MRPYGLRGERNYRPRPDTGDIDWVYLLECRHGEQGWVAVYITRGGYGEQKEMPARLFREHYRQMGDRAGLRVRRPPREKRGERP